MNDKDVTTLKTLLVTVNKALVDTVDEITGTNDAAILIIVDVGGKVQLAGNLDKEETWALIEHLNEQMKTDQQITEEIFRVPTK